MYIPNVEVVTLLIVVFTYVFGIGIGMGATILFCVLEGFIWGFDPSWIIAYFIHWPTVAVVAFLITKSRVKNPITIAVIFSLVTALFGLQSTFIYMLTGGAVGTSGWVTRYWAMYTAGSIFYIIQCVSCLISVSIGFSPLSAILTKLKVKYFV